MSLLSMFGSTEEDRRQLEGDLLAIAKALGLSAPRPGPRETFVAEGEVAGHAAELRAGGRGWYEVSVRVDASGIPAGLSLGARPVGLAPPCMAP